MIHKCSYCLEEINIEVEDFIQIEMVIEDRTGYMLFHEDNCWKKAEADMRSLGMSIPPIATRMI